MPVSKIDAVDGFATRTRFGKAGRLRLCSQRLAAGLAMAAVATWLAPAASDAVLLSARNGQLASFSGGISQVNGTLTSISHPYAADVRAFAARYVGSDASGAARGSFKVRWKRGQSVAFGAAFYLPRRFHTATRGQQALLAWDSSPDPSGRSEQGGVVVDYSTNSAYLVDATVSGAATTQRVLAGPFRLPMGRWFTLQVRQRLGAGASAFSQVYENLRLVASSRAPNFSGARIDHVHYGIVQLSGGAQQGEVSLEFDRAIAAGYTGYVNPFRGDHYFTGRTDMGVDLCLRPGEPIRAIGDAIVIGISPSWFKYQPYIWYQLVDGPYAGRYIYVAEQITRLARVGAPLSAGRPVAFYKRSGTCIETGWGAANGATLAQATTGYREGQVTVAGVSFARFLISRGVHGPFNLAPTGR